MTKTEIVKSLDRKINKLAKLLRETEQNNMGVKYMYDFLIKVKSEIVNNNRLLRNDRYHATLIFNLKEMHKFKSLADYYNQMGDNVDNVSCFKPIGLYLTNGEYIKI